MGPQLLPWHSQCQGSARAQAPNGEVRGGYPADCIAPASPDHNTKVKKPLQTRPSSGRTPTRLSEKCNFAPYTVEFEVAKGCTCSPAVGEHMTPLGHLRPRS